MDLGLRGKRCIITGGSDGIGAAAAFQFAAEGVAIGLVARRRDRLESVATRAASLGAPSTAVATADLRDPVQLTAALDELTGALGGVDILVNNAGDSRAGTLESLDDAAWRDSFDLKLMGYVRCMRYVLPRMREQRSGCIVNVLGTAGTQPSPNYVLSCFVTALAQLTASIADEVAPEGVRVVGLSPGYTRTERVMAPIRRLAEQAGETVETFAEEFASTHVPLGRLATPEEIGKLIVILASDAAAFVTGTQLLADGGASRAI